MSAIRWPVGQYIVQVEKLEPGIWHWDLLDIAGDSLIPFDDADLQIVDSHEAAMSRALGKAATLYMKLEDVEIPRMTSPAPEFTIKPIEPASLDSHPSREQLLKLIPPNWTRDRREAAQKGLVKITVDELVSNKYINSRLWSWSKHSLRVCVQQEAGVFYEVSHIQPSRDSAFPYTAYLLPDLKEISCKSWFSVCVGLAGAFYVVLKPLLEQVLEWENTLGVKEFDYASIRVIKEGIDRLGKDTANIPHLVMLDWYRRLFSAAQTILIYEYPSSMKRRVEEAYYTCLILYAAEL